jgi:hypothetical protein
VVLVLHSTYWQFDPTAATSAVAPTGGPQVAPGAGCGPTVPGSGCGTVTLNLRAAHAGTTAISASRVSCGEALRCTSDQSHFVVTLTVAAG